MGKQGSLELAYSDLDHIVDNLYTLAESHQEVTQKNIDTALNVARDIVVKSAGISNTEETIEWTAVNQFTNDRKTLSLPKMMVGDKWLGEVTSQDESVLVVDEVKDLLNVTCTIFQKINDQGDMLQML